MAAAARNRNPRRSLVDAAAETLRRRIAEGDFGPSERLPPERVLTDELGVSRSVLR
jgi:GntR family transcriptional regulator, transcriptional repressor for pyruvate dehydrogenase complex